MREACASAERRKPEVSDLRSGIFLNERVELLDGSATLLQRPVAEKSQGLDDERESNSEAIKDRRTANHHCISKILKRIGFCWI